MKKPAKQCRNSTVQPLEPRRLFSGEAYSQTLADQLVANIQQANNAYVVTSTPVVSIAGVNGATTYSNSSDCSSFATTLLEEAYGFTSAQFTTWTGYALPQAKYLYNAAVADDGFTGFLQIADVQVGDAMFLKYLDGYSDSSGDSGHVVTVDALPLSVTSPNPAERAYNLTVVDCTEDPHSNDTRNGGGQGVGRGTMRLYTDLSGNLISYSWGTSQSSVIYTQTERATIFAKMPATAANPFLAAGSQATWNASTHALAITGAASIISDPGSTIQPSITIDGSGSKLLIMPGANSVVHVNSLTMTNSSSATLYAPNPGALLLDVAAYTTTTGVVSVDSTSRLDLDDNDMIVHVGSLATINSLIASGYNNGNWLGYGIASTASSADPSHMTGLGAILNSSGGKTITTSFDGVNASASDVLVRHTYYGDANLDGRVDGSDYTLIDNGFHSHLTGWFNGDFNFDNAINGSDYTLADNVFNTQGSPLVFTAQSQIAAVTPAARIVSTTPTPAAHNSWWITVDDSENSATSDLLKKKKST